MRLCCCVTCATTRARRNRLIVGARELAESRSEAVGLAEQDERTAISQDVAGSERGGGTGIDPDGNGGCEGHGLFVRKKCFTPVRPRRTPFRMERPGPRPEGMKTKVEKGEGRKRVGPPERVARCAS